MNFLDAAHVIGIDVSEDLFQTTTAVLESVGIGQVSLHLSHTYKQEIIEHGDFAFSYVVMQHIPKAIQKDYLRFFADWLNPGGTLLFQFLVGDYEDSPNAAEPHFWWRVDDLWIALQKVPLSIENLDIMRVESTLPSVFHAWARMVRE